MLCLKCGAPVGSVAKLCEGCTDRQEAENSSTSSPVNSGPKQEQEDVNLIRLLCAWVIGDRRLFFCVAGLFLSLFLLYFSLVAGGSSLALALSLSFLGSGAVMFCVQRYPDAEPYDATEVTKALKVISGVGAAFLLLSAFGC